MAQASSREVENFRREVAIKFQLYNSLFTSLPFHRIENTGILLSLFLTHCEEGYAAGHSPSVIVEDFFAKYTALQNPTEKTDLLFRFVQYAERQVVLFDAVEDAAFNEINDVGGAGTLKQLAARVAQEDLGTRLRETLSDFAVALVLTAHPTQFYPGPVLGIINDLSNALKENNAPLINSYLQQLGKTPLFKKQKPTPYDEAVSLIWYLENVFYNAVGRLVSEMRSKFSETGATDEPIIKMGFWPGGDRDGNPNVTAFTTLKVAEALRSSIIKCYYLDIRRLKRRLTFEGIEAPLAELEAKLYRNIFIPGGVTDLSQTEMLQTLHGIRNTLTTEHNSLFVGKLDNLIQKMEMFGLHFASLDVRQESSVHNTVLEALAENETGLPKHYASLSEGDKMKVLVSCSAEATGAAYKGMVKDTLECMAAVRTIQRTNGELGCNRYIISQTGSALNVLEVYGLFRLCGWSGEDLAVDIVPLFETINDLQSAPAVMESLYANEAYVNHLRRRANTQTIMVGFSDGTKDGGYLMANWSIYKAKAELTSVSKKFGIEVIFFDGRGGPPARGGGKTHRFYASMGRDVSTREIQLTIQGQTVSSSFGNIDSAKFNLEQLLNAGLTNRLFSEAQKTLTPEQTEVIQELADYSYAKYRELKDHPQFLTYLADVSPLNYYSETNISSRPSKRGSGGKLELKDLRAIPFVGAWSQLKQNVPGYYGLGTALQKIEAAGKATAVQRLYQRSQYFRTLIDNCEMAMQKNFFPLTAYLADHPQYGGMWRMVVDEYKLTEAHLFNLTGKTELMADYPVEKTSIQMRERIVLPLTTIQQYALIGLREGGADEERKGVLRKLIVRTSPGIINAGRNSV